MRQNPAKSTCCLGFYGHSGGWTTISLAIDLCSPCFNHISPKLDVLIRAIPYHSTSQNRGKKTHFFEGSAPHDILFGILFRPFIWHLYLTVHMIYFSIICSANRHNILVFLHNRHFIYVFDIFIWHSIWLSWPAYVLTCHRFFKTKMHLTGHIIDVWHFMYDSLFGILAFYLAYFFWHSIWYSFGSQILCFMFWLLICCSIGHSIWHARHGILSDIDSNGSSAGRLPAITDHFTGDPWLQIRGVSRMACVIRLGLY